MSWSEPTIFNVEDVTATMSLIGGGRRGQCACLHIHIMTPREGSDQALTRKINNVDLYFTVNGGGPATERQVLHAERLMAAINSTSNSLKKE